MPTATDAFRLAARMSRMKTSAIRDILKVTERPDIISFAGGLPAAELFPVEALAQALADVLAREGGAALQYSTTEGFVPLREWLCDRLERRGLRCEVDQVLITSGSQQGIDLVSKVLLDPGDAVLLENPSYLAALQTFGGFEARLVLVGSDEQGMDVDEAERVLEHERPKLIYVVPDFQNPRGTTLSLDRRRKLLELAGRHRVPILEDDPDGELRYRDEPIPPLAALDEDGLVVHLGTFSKTLAPGLRLGWAVAPKPLVRQLTVAKQASDLHTSTLSQRAVTRLLEHFDYDGHLRMLRQTYGRRCDAMLEALARYLPASTRWTRPDGGLFLWVELPEGVTAEALLEEALKQKVAFVPGAPFFAANPNHRFARFNFSNRPPEGIEEGMRRIGRALEALAGASWLANPFSREENNWR